MLTFTPLSGAARSSRTGPLAYILQVDDVTVLLDCGSPDWCPEPSSSALKTDDLEDQSSHWERYCQKLREVAPNVDLVLLSHGDLAHTGLYAYAYARWGLKAPAYSTLPVQAMGRIASTEEVEGIRDEEDVGGEPPEDTEREGEAAETGAMDVDGEPDAEKTAPPSMENKKGKYLATPTEVHDAFDSINTLRYSQPTHLQGKSQGLTITPFNAGHTLGGTIWKIRSPSAGTIIYAVHMNHMRERHLDGTVLLRQSGGIFEPLARPDVLITDALRADFVSSRRKDRDAALIDTITTTLSSRSSVLLPCDASTRVLELLVLLDQHWSFARLKFPICLLSRTGREMLTHVRSMMEWLGGTVNKEDVGDEGPGRRGKRKRDEEADEEAIGALSLRFRHLEFFTSPQQLTETYSSKDPKLILAVPASLSYGPSRVLFSDFAAVPDNVILLTSKGEEGTLAAQYESAPSGRELEEFLQKERAEKEKQVAQQLAIAHTQQMLEADEADEDESSDSEAESEDEESVERALGGGDERERKNKDEGWLDEDDNAKQLLSFDIYLKGNVSRATSFFKSSGRESQRFRMFPFVEKKRRVDEYGEVVDVGMWLRKGKIMEEEAESEESKERRRKDEETKKTPREPPSKYISTYVEVQLACRLLFVDMEGLNDGRATKMLIPQVNPRKMILVHASPSATGSLIESCSNIRAMTKDIFAPAQGDTVQIGQNMNSFAVSLSDALIASVKMSRFEDNEVGYVTGRIVGTDSSVIPTLEPAAAVSSDATTLAAQPGAKILGARPLQRLPHSTMIGELKLTALKTRLAAVGVYAELVGYAVVERRPVDLKSLPQFEEDALLGVCLDEARVERECKIDELGRQVKRVLAVDEDPLVYISHRVKECGGIEMSAILVDSARLRPWRRHVLVVRDPDTVRATFEFVILGRANAARVLNCLAARARLDLALQRRDRIIHVALARWL
ncbi:hypothetical protein EWM64_g677 [Hericium alpestre]|uniref:Cleavage and polyadenylation specificity factor subunit 2 n=1 Tax=Hericium alpestre TaxID=135208 RepID=A0A4Z0A8D0_9AGAM|nr:hypothetical protein EWM64_g677 [Hericium alpestre]